MLPSWVLASDIWFWYVAHACSRSDMDWFARLNRALRVSAFRSVRALKFEDCES